MALGISVYCFAFLHVLHALANNAGYISSCVQEWTLAGTSPEDLSWREYVQHVYGRDAPNEIMHKKHSFNILYKGSPVNVRVSEWGHKRLLWSLNESWGDTYFRYTDRVYPDHSWVEVSRYSTHFLNSYQTSKDEWEEGFSLGFPDRSLGNTTKVPYGCWFSTARGSGIYVNVGKTLVIPDKYLRKQMRRFGLADNGCLPSENSSLSCFDRYTCTAALAQGYDSVQVLARYELVICSGKCATETLRYTCPPVELRSGPTAQGECNCSDDSHLLNCGNRPSSVPNLKWNFNTSGVGNAAQQHTLCLTPTAPSPPEPFNMTILFTAGMYSSGRALPVAAVQAAHNATKDASFLLVDLGDASGWSGSLSLQQVARRGLRCHHPIAVSHPQPTPVGPYRHDGHKYNKEMREAARRHRHQHFSLAASRTAEGNLLRDFVGEESEFSIVVDRRQERSPSSPMSEVERSLLCHVDNVKIGLVLYAPREPWRSAEEHLRLYIDEAMCLRNFGAVMVLLLNAGEEQLNETFLQGLRGYVEVVLSVGSLESRQKCHGKKHPTNSSGVMEVNIVRTRASMGMVRSQYSRSAQSIAFKSEILAI